MHPVKNATTWMLLNTTNNGVILQMYKNNDDNALK